MDKNKRSFEARYTFYRSRMLNQQTLRLASFHPAHNLLTTERRIGIRRSIGKYSQALSGDRTGDGYNT